MECYRPFICAESCDGPVLRSGCCPCAPGQVDRVIDCRPEPTPAPEAAPACSDASECRLVTDCACACVAELVSTPVLEGQAWQTQCNGGPPPNCGAESPCATHTANCVEGQCVVR